MNDTMRRKDRKISEDDTFEILKRGEFGILSMCTADNEGYGIPLNYVLWNNSIFFHCAVEGKKLDYIRNNNKVSFCVIGKTKLLPSDFGTLYESCIVSGSAVLVEGDEKRDALVRLVEKYSADFVSEGGEYITKFIDKTNIVKISIDSISGKARKK